jgi:hypothetical protein
MKLLHNFRVSNSNKNTGSEISIEDINRDEVIRIHAVFFKKSGRKQRQTLSLLIWWAIKHYFRILFKR